MRERKHTSALVTVIVVTFALGLGATPAVAAGTYFAYVCKGGAGVPAQQTRFVATNPDLYAGGWSCADPALDPGTAKYLRVHTAGGGTAGPRSYGRIVINPPHPLYIAKVSGQWWQPNLEAGFRHRLLLVRPGGEEAVLQATDPGAGRPTLRDWGYSLGSEGRFDYFASELLCARTESRCDKQPVSAAAVNGLRFKVVDEAWPTAQIVPSPALDGAWRTGTVSFGHLAADAGSGVRRTLLRLDGAPVAQVGAGRLMACNSGWAGEEYARGFQPCPASVTGTLSLDTRAVPDGAHALRQCARDFAGNEGCTAPGTLRVDNNPPPAPVALRVVGGEGWHRRNGFEVTWINPDQGRGSPIAGVHWRLFRDGAAIDRPRYRPGGAARLDDIRVPGPGAYRLRLWLRDAAGADPAHRAGVTLRFDGRPGRGGPRLSAHLSRGRGRAGARRLRVGYGAGGLVGGRLRAASGSPLRGQRIELVERFDRGATTSTRRRRLRTGRRGRFSARLRRGPSRTVRVRFVGSRRLGHAVARPLRLQVAGRATLAARPDELRSGDAVTFSGRVRARAAVLPARGKLVAIQFHDPLRASWRAIAVVRADAGGRYRYRYRFGSLAGVRVRFRAAVLPEGAWPYVVGYSPSRAVTVAP